jgi:hypothetical protein
VSDSPVLSGGAIGNGSPFVIVAMGRTGSTMLTGMLDSHPQIECRGELFKPGGEFQHSGLSRRPYLERAAYLTNAPVKGFKMPFDWILDHPGIFDDLLALGYRVIRLTRVSPVEQFASALLAQKNNAWNSEEPYAAQSIEIDPWNFLTFLGTASLANVAMDRMTAQFQRLYLTYESLGDAQTRASLLRFLGVAQHALTTSTVRSRVVPLQEAVTNYQELVRFFSGGPYAELFPETGVSAAAS